MHATVFFFSILLIDFDYLTWEGTSTFCSIWENDSSWSICWRSSNLEIIISILWNSLCLVIDSVFDEVLFTFWYDVQSSRYFSPCAIQFQNFLFIQTLSNFIYTGVCCIILEEILKCMAYWMQSLQVQLMRASVEILQWYARCLKYTPLLWIQHDVPYM